MLMDCLGRIAQRNRELGAMVFVDERRARRAAAASARRRRDGQRLSDVDGMPIAVKANIAVAGLPLTAGVAAYRDQLAATDATCVARLRAAGAVIIGLTNMDEAALGATTDNPWAGRHAQSACPRLYRGRIIGGISRGRCRWILHRGARHRHHRQHPHPGGILRCVRPQTGPRLDLDRRRHSTLAGP